MDAWSVLKNNAAKYENNIRSICPEYQIVYWYSIQRYIIEKMPRDFYDEYASIEIIKVGCIFQQIEYLWEAFMLIVDGR